MRYIRIIPEQQQEADMSSKEKVLSQPKTMVQGEGGRAAEKSALRTQRLAILGVLAALVVVLAVAGAIPVGTFTITLTLVPIVVGAILYGWQGGALLGTIFGVIVAIQVVTGAAGAFSTAMLEYAPAVTVLTCILKGTAAGLFAGLFFRWFSRRNLYLGTIMAAIIAPVANTGIFSIMCLSVFRPLVLSALGLTAESGGVLTAFLVGFIGVNFVIELVINIVLAPVIMRIVTAAKKNVMH